MSFAKGRWLHSVGCIAMLIAAGCSSDSAGKTEAGVDAPVISVDAADVAIPSRVDADVDRIAAPADAADSGFGAIDSAPADTTDATPLAGLVISGGPDLGTVQIPYTGVSVTFTVTNASDAASGTLTVSTSSKEFVITADKCSGKELAPSETCTVGVALSPVSVGDKSALLTIKGATTAQLPIKGTGMTHGHCYCPVVSPLAWDFGAVVVDTTGASKTFTVANEGIIPTDAPTVSIAGAAAASFIATSTCNGPLAVNASCAVTVTFKPRLGGALAATLLVRSGDQSATAALSGTGVLPMQLQIASAVPANGYSQSLVPAAGTQLNYLDWSCNNVADGAGFAPVVVGDSSATPSSYTFTLSASSDARGVETGAISPTIGGDAAADFRVGINTCTSSLLMGQTCTIEVKFAPAAPGVRAAQLTVRTETGGEAKSTIYAVGRPLVQLFPLGNATHAITLPTATLPVTGLNFGNQAVGMPGETFTFRAQVWGSTTSSRLNPLIIAMSGNDAGDFRIVDNGCSAAATKTVPYACDVAVQFYPQTSSVSKAATLVATGTGGTAQVNLTGKADRP